MILIIDDEVHVREVIQDSLAFAEIEAISAESGAAGLALFEERQTDIEAIILDLTMPGLDGRATLSRIRTLAPAVPVILTSGLGEADLASVSEQDRTIIQLAKPFTLELLLAAISRARELKQARL
jgi:DNA-binding NtrC family response regulator